MLAFALAVIAFALLVYVVAFYVIPRFRDGNEQAFDSFMFFDSLRGWT